MSQKVAQTSPKSEMMDICSQIRVLSFNNNYKNIFCETCCKSKVLYIFLSKLNFLWYLFFFLKKSYLFLKWMYFEILPIVYSCHTMKMLVFLTNESIWWNASFKAILHIDLRSVKSILTRKYNDDNNYIIIRHYYIKLKSKSSLFKFW